MQRALPSRHLDVVSQFRNSLDQLQEIFAIESKDVHRGAAPHRRLARSAFGQRGLAETIARAQRAERDFVAVRHDLDRARPPGRKHIKRVGRIAFAHDDVAKLVMFLFQQ